MSTKRTAEAAWIEAESRWKVNVQKNGRRRSFYSSIKGRKGKHEAEAKADTWLESGTEDMRFPEAWAQYLDHCRSVSESAYQKAEQYGRLYITPNIGARKLSAVTPLLWQSCIDAGAKKKLSRRSCVNIRAAITAFVRYALRALVDPASGGRRSAHPRIRAREAGKARHSAGRHPPAVCRSHHPPLWPRRPVAL